MASISIGNLNFTGEDLLLDSESYLDSLSDELAANVKGGLVSFPYPTFWDAVIKDLSKKYSGS
jgi:hypothetical protein